MQEDEILPFSEQVRETHGKWFSAHKEENGMYCLLLTLNSRGTVYEWYVLPYTVLSVM